MAREFGGFWRHIWIRDFELRVSGVGAGGMVAISRAVGGDILIFVCGDPYARDDAAANRGAALCDRMFSGDRGAGRAGVDAGDARARRKSESGFIAGSNRRWFLRMNEIGSGRRGS